MDYKNGKIYSIRSYQTDKIYIGSTTQPLSKRLYHHKTHYKKYLNGKSPFITSYDILQYEDAYIELLEEYPCENREQLCKREGELIRGGNCVNKRIEARTKQEYYEQNKDKLLQQGKEYQEQNKDKIKEYIKEYQEQNKDKILQQKKEYYQQNKDKILQKGKEYREQNKEKINEYQKEYREQNRDKILQKQKERAKKDR